MRHRAFLSWFSLSIGLAIALFFAAYFGIISRVWASDLSHVTAVIAAVVIATVALLGYVAWGCELRLSSYELVRWSRVASQLCPALGLLGTVYGLSLQAAALQSGADVLPLLATSLFATMTGVAGMIVLEVFSFVVNLQVGVE